MTIDSVGVVQTVEFCAQCGHRYRQGLGHVCQGRYSPLVSSAADVVGATMVRDPVDHQAREAHIRDQAYKEGLRVGLEWGRKVSERILKQSLDQLQRDFNPRSLPEHLQRSADDGKDGLSLGDPYAGKSRLDP